jgi:hypothetical protein
MKVFLGWSDTKSFETAQAFNEWLPKVIQAVDPFISSGIPKGKRWGKVLIDELEETKVGILCLTRENLDSNWLLYEAGALSKTKDAYVCTFLLDLKPTDIEEPLASFQHTIFEKDDIRKLIDTINKAVENSGERSLSENHLNIIFETFWPELKEELKNIVEKEAEVDQPIREEREILEEILAIVRALEKEQREEKYQKELRDALISYLRTKQIKFDDKIVDMLIEGTKDIFIESIKEHINEDIPSKDNNEDSEG